MEFKYLSYVIHDKNPAYGRGYDKIKIYPLKSIERGDSCNVSRFEIENHCGTHVDCPAHFFKDSPNALDYPEEAWIFNKPFIVKLPLKESRLIYPEDIGDVPKGADIILIKTGFFKFRQTKRYNCNNPGIAASTGIWLRKKHPCVRALGFDFISLSSFQNRKEGQEAHRAFLDPRGSHKPILLIEDMDLSCELSALISVLIAPLRIAGLDSVPCTILGIFNNHLKNKRRKNGR